MIRNHAHTGLKNCSLEAELDEAAQVRSTTLYLLLIPTITITIPLLYYTYTHTYYTTIHGTEPIPRERGSPS